MKRTGTDLSAFFRRKRCLLLSILVLAALAKLSFSGVGAPPDSLLRQLRASVELTLNHHYPSAEAPFRRMIRERADEPAGYLLLAYSLQAQMVDAEDYSRRPEFEALIRQCLAAAGRLPGDGWADFCAGYARLYQAFISYQTGHRWSAFRKAGKGVKLLRRALQSDSSLTDAYLGIGSFLYWKSAKLKMFKWLPFVHDRRREGIERVRKTAENGRVFGALARDELVRILDNEKRYKAALKLARANARDYPESRFFRWTLANALFKAGLKEEASQAYQKLAKQYRQLPRGNHLNELNCLLRAAEIEYGRKNFAAVDSLAVMGLSYSFPAPLRGKAKPMIKALMKLSHQASRNAAK